MACARVCDFIVFCRLCALMMSVCICRAACGVGCVSCDSTTGQCLSCGGGAVPQYGAGANCLTCTAGTYAAPGDLVCSGRLLMRPFCDQLPQTPLGSSFKSELDGRTFWSSECGKSRPEGVEGTRSLTVILASSQCPLPSVQTVRLGAILDTQLLIA